MRYEELSEEECEECGFSYMQSHQKSNPSMAIC